MKDIKNLDFNEFIGPLKDNNYERELSGLYPYTAGPYASMYLGRPWTIRQYAGFSTAEESNAFYKKNLEQGQKGLSVAFDLPTHRGYDSDNERVSGDVGKAGVAIDSVEDMKILFDQIPLDKMSVSMTMNGAVVPILAFFIVAAEEQGVSQELLKGTIQNDILKEFLVRNTYIYPPEPSLAIISDIFSYTSQNMPGFNSISISGYHMHEAGAPADLELAYTIADGLEYIKTGIESGLSVDQFAPRLSFFWAIGMDMQTEIAKLRAGRKLWAEYLAEFNPKNSKSMMLRTHCQTSGWSLTAQEPKNNIARTTFEALAAILGQTQSLHTNSFDEALALPSDYSARIARNTQLILEHETKLTETIDTFGSSKSIEEKTQKLYKKAKKLIDEVIKAGGMTSAIEKGIPQNKIEEAAAIKQTNIEKGKELLIGVNAFHYRGASEEIKLLTVDNKKVFKNQVSQLRDLKEKRNKHEVEQSLYYLKKAAKEKKNILSSAIEAARHRATLGEISDVLESEYGRYAPISKPLTGVFKSQMKEQEEYKKVIEASRQFEDENGRRPRILVAKMGQDGHDRGAKIIATSFSDMGFDVDMAPLFGTPDEVLQQALDNDVHVIGISSLAGAHEVLIPELAQKLKENNAEDIILVAGGIIPKNDYEDLYNAGVSHIFGPGTVITSAALDILSALKTKHV